MGCIYSHDCICEFYDADNLEGIPTGCSKKDGECIVEDDPIPSDNCEQYESDSTCFGCGADHNQDEECTCCDDEEYEEEQEEG